MTRTYDFAVVGRGMMGTACARWLAEAGHSVALIGPDEPRDRTAHRGPFASHHDAGRITRRVSPDMRWSAWSSASIARYRELEAATGVVFFHEHGALMAGHRRGAMAPFVDGFVAVAKTLLPRPEILDAGEVRRRFGYALPEDTVASFEAKLGGWINPRLYRMALENRAMRAGATVVHTAAHSIEKDVILAGADKIRAGQVVLATGAYAVTDMLLPARPKMWAYARTVAFAEVAGPLRMPTLIWVPEGLEYELYMLPPIQYPDGKWYLKIGGESLSPLLSNTAQMTEWYQGQGGAGAGAALLRELRKVLPDVPWSKTHTEPCAVTFTQSGYPYIDRVSERLTLLTGGNGAGAKCCDELGRMGAEVALGGATPDLAVVWA